MSKRLSDSHRQDSGDDSDDEQEAYRRFKEERRRSRSASDNRARVGSMSRVGGAGSTKASAVAAYLERERAKKHAKPWAATPKHSSAKTSGLQKRKKIYVDDDDEEEEDKYKLFLSGKKGAPTPSSSKRESKLLDNKKMGRPSKAELRYMEEELQRREEELAARERSLAERKSITNLRRVHILPPESDAMCLFPLSAEKECRECKRYWGRYVVKPCGHAFYCPSCINNVREKAMNTGFLQKCLNSFCDAHIEGWILGFNVN